MKILIVDDEKINIALIKAALSDLEYDLVVAMDGEEGIALAKREMPDIIILDVMMPKLDGFKVCGRLKADKRFSQIPVVILSSRAGEDDVDIAREVGADVYMVKPFDRDELNRNVKKLLREWMLLRDKEPSDKASIVFEIQGRWTIRNSLGGFKKLGFWRGEGKKFRLLMPNRTILRKSKGIQTRRLKDEAIDRIPRSFYS